MPNLSSDFPRILLLDPQVAEKIAAGEVIERPASIVKELIENALDAGASQISVMLEAGGQALIEVTDNGHGMRSPDLAIAPTRHATSKIRELADLEKILTLGFRGEALPSVAAVSDLTIISRAREPEAQAHEWSSGKVAAVTHGHFLNSPHGTRIQARGLFSQIPARLKFLKSAGSEVSMVREWMEKLALSRPETGFELWHHEKRVLSLRPESLPDRVRSVLLDGEAYPVLESERTYSALKVKLHWVQGYTTPTTKKLIQIVNGRILRDRLIQQAIMGAFKQILLPGQFPALVLSIDIDPSHVDVNVHPTKTEVRFLEPRGIFSAVHSLIEKLIHHQGAAVSVPTALGASGWESRAPYLASPRKDFLPSFSTTQPAFSHSLGTSSSPTEASESPSVTPGAWMDPSRYKGQVFQNYLLFEQGIELMVIDQHAAHERIRYEKLKSQVLGQKGELQIQELLIPEVVHFDATDRGEILARLPWFQSLGFEAEIFGEASLVIRTIPTVWGKQGLGPRLKSLLDRILEAEVPPNTDLKLDAALFEKVASEACHSAIRSGDLLTAEHAQALLQELWECEHPWNCPHGRPTVVRLGKSKFEEWFLRRV